MSAETVNGWIDEGRFIGGMSFGDGQVSDDVTRRYAKHLTDGTFAVIEEAYAVIDKEELWGESVEKDQRFYVDERISYVVSHSKDDPFNNAIWEDMMVGEGSYLAYSTIEDAAREAIRMASDNRYTFNWGGQ